MTPEQFVFWLSGYLSGLEHDESIKNFPMLLREEVQKVRTVKDLQSVALQGCYPFS